MAEKEIARDTEQAIPAHEAEAGADEARTPDSPGGPAPAGIPTPDRHGALTQADIDAALRDWNGDMESKRAVVRYMKEHGREKDTAAWLQQEYGDNLPAFPVTADGAAGDVPWPKVQRRIAQLIQRDEFFTEQERMNLRTLTRWRYGSGLAERGIVDGKVVDPEKLGSDPFIQRVMSDAEQIAEETAPRFSVVMTSDAFLDPEDAFAVWDRKATIIMPMMMGRYKHFPMKNPHRAI